MKGIVMLLAIFLVGCNQIAEPDEGAAECGSRADCAPDETCVDSKCIAVTDQATPAPALEREADDLGKLGVERDMLESNVKLTKESLDEAIEELAGAKSESEQSAARTKKSRLAAAHKKAVEALEAFKTQHTP